MTATTASVPRPVRWALLLAIGLVTLWLRLQPLALSGLDPETQALFQYADAAGRPHVYLGDYDSYVWLRAARSYLRHGTTCDQVVDGVCRDTQTHAPVGREMRYGRSMHIVAIVGLHRLLTAVRPEHPLPATAYLVPVILGLLVIPPAFGIGRRLGGDLAGLAASAAVAWNPFFLTRSAGSDNDVWNVVLPILLVWAIVRALTASTLVRAVGWSLGAAAVVGMHAGTWGGWPLVYGIVLAALGVQLLATVVHALARDEVGSATARAWRAARAPAAITAAYYVGCFATTSIVGVEQDYLAIPASMLQQLGPVLAFAASTAPAEAGPPLQWPSVFAGVAELYRPAQAELALAVGGAVAQVVGWLGFVLLLLPWRRWHWRHRLVAALGVAIVARLQLGAPLDRVWLTYLLLVPVLAATIVRVVLDGDERAEAHDAGAALVAAVWFFAASVLAPAGARYALFLVAPFGLAFGHALGRLHRMFGLLPPPVRRGALPAAVLVTVLLLVPTLRLTHALASHYRPRIHDGWWNTFVAVRAETPPDAVLNLWWDYGYWAKYVAERRVSADGGSLRTRIPYWTARSLLADTEAEAIGLLRMLNCGSAAASEPEGRASAHARLVAHGVAPVAAYRLVLELASRDRDAAVAVLAARGLDAEARRDVLAASHCTPPPALLILSTEQIRRSSWKTLARARPDGADVPDLPEWRRDLLVDDWIDCTVTGERWECPVPRRGRPSWLTHVALEAGDPGSVRLTLHRPRQPGSALVATPTLVVRAGADARVETPVRGETPAEVAVLADLVHERVLAGAHDLIRSTFLHLLLLDGRYARRLTKVDERRGVGGSRVTTWRIDWDGDA